MATAPGATAPGAVTAKHTSSKETRTTNPWLLHPGQLKHKKVSKRIEKHAAGAAAPGPNYSNRK